MDAEIFGVSPDSRKSHQKFKTKYGLPYLLLVDEGHKLADAFGIWKEKHFAGVKYMGVERTTVLLDRDGKVARVWSKVKVPGHAEEVLEAARNL